jgi:YVTN family beta-propeller protein
VTPSIERRTTKTWLLGFFACALACGALLCGAAMAEQYPAATELPGKPFYIRQTWVVGGEGNWDYLTLDPTALQLFVAHGPVVQVVDVGTGKVTGVVSGMKDAHGIALDDTGNLGYISDGPNDEVKVFDRRTLAVVATVHTGPNPRAIVFDPASKLVFAICTEQPSGQPATNPAIAAARQTARNSTTARRPAGRQPEFDPDLQSVVTVIDSETSTRLADVMLPGKLGFAQTDGNGQIYVNITDRNQIARFDARAIETELHRQSHHPEARPVAQPGPHSEAEKPSAPFSTLDWTKKASLFSLGSACTEPRGLAIDANHLRLFTACSNMKMQVLNADTGDVVATLPIGPGADAIGYDSSRGLIFTSNGGGDGSMTIIRQDVTDSYAIIQQLPTRQRARTLAVNSVTGQVYVVTNLIGFDLNEKGTGGSAHTLPVVHAKDVKGSFQVLVIGTDSN